VAGGREGRSTEDKKQKKTGLLTFKADFAGKEEHNRKGKGSKSELLLLFFSSFSRLRRCFFATI
jgi:hypothetical protein